MSLDMCNIKDLILSSSESFLEYEVTTSLATEDYQHLFSGIFMVVNLIEVLCVPFEFIEILDSMVNISVMLLKVL